MMPLSPAPSTSTTPSASLPAPPAATAEQLAEAGRIRREAAGVLRDLSRMHARRSAGHRLAPAEVDVVALRVAALQERIDRSDRHPGMGPVVRAARHSIHMALLVTTELLGLV
jgi:hypothetical protein